MHPSSPLARPFRSLSTSSTASSPRPSTITSRPSFPWVPFNPGNRSTPTPSSSSWERDTPTPAMKREATQAPSVTGGSAFVEEQTMKQWSFNAFEWQVRDVRALRKYLDYWSAEQALVGSPGRTEASGEGSQKNIPELLRESPIIGDGKFKLEVCASYASTDSESPVDAVGSPGARLSVFVTSLMLDYAPHTNTELCTTMMAAVKVRGDLAGERGARADWLWEFWDQDWTFRKESEFWECPLPPLATILEHPRVAATNSFVLCVQIHTPVGPQIPQQPSIHYVPKDLLEGIEVSLDNANTGDVQFVCLERLAPSNSPSGSLTPNSRRSSSESSAYPAQSSSQLIARKRIIYAHSDILKTRAGGEYFSTMFSSGFAESAAAAPGERKMHTVIVEEADFNTIYWMLKWVYGNWLLFQEEDDPRIVFNSMGQGQSARWLSSPYTSGSGQGPVSTQQAGEWDWQTLRRIDTPSEAGSLGQSLRSLVLDDANPEQAQPSSQGSGAPEITAQEQSTRPTAMPAPRTTVRSPSTAGSTVRRGAKGSSAGPSSSARGGAAGGSSTGPFRTGSTGFASVPPHTPRYPHAHSPAHPHPHALPPRPQPDPHPHPTPPPPPASALAVYQTAHRYALPGLAQLALEHLLGTITPQRAFALLLATRVWDELHALVADYVVDAWDEVARSEEFEGCCREVAAGEWGTDGGKTLAELFRRLQSPSSARYNRT
ncbi:hypothetical protein FS749_013642 [Ceratobasidium sp. UAMH 11750]|nr:hypothetical protein FS749_013642 [Ceratobasidium sp. UAMH 11750]